MHKIGWLAIVILSLSWRQDYTIHHSLLPRFEPMFYDISEDGMNRPLRCRSSSVEFQVGKQSGFTVSVEHLSGFGNMLAFNLDVPEPVEVRGFEVDSPWSDFRLIGKSSFPIHVSSKERFRMREVRLASPDFVAGNTFHARIELSRATEEPATVHRVELGGVLVERTGSMPFESVQLEPSIDGNWSVTEAEVGGMDGGPCGKVNLALSARMLDPDTLIVRFDASPPVELRRFGVLGPRRNPAGFRSLVSVFGADVRSKLPARLVGINELYYRLLPEAGGKLVPDEDDETLDVEFVIGNCPYTDFPATENRQTIRFRTRPVRSRAASGN